MSAYSIMVIDPENETLDNLKKRLNAAGYDKVDTFVNPAEALKVFEENKYHIVLTALAMTEMDGIELLKQIREYDPMTQTIMMTGDSSIEKILICLECGANDFILKPFKSDDYVLEVIDFSIKKLERWREAMIGTFQ
jgi:DNA-binding NtrC family response regulator